MTQCEGWVRQGGAFTLGPVIWKQCENEATVHITIIQDGETKEFPACQECWQKALDPKWKIEIKEVVPLKKTVKK